MNDSLLVTLTVPAAGSKNPSVLAHATNNPARVFVNNVGGTTLILSHDATSLTQQPALAGTFQLLSGQSGVYVLAPKQGLFAVGQGAGGTASVAISDALSNQGWGS